jgi:hypothetical protein
MNDICKRRMFGNHIISSSDMCHGCALEVCLYGGRLETTPFVGLGAGM